MWLFTKYGFYSIVKKKYGDQEKPFQARARKRKDLENLLKLVPMEGEIIDTLYADYYYRFVVDQEELGRIFDLLVENLDYDIFKDMTTYVDRKYTTNTSRTFIARGSEAGIVIMTMFKENTNTSLFDNFVATDSPPSFNSVIIELIESGKFPQDKGKKKLHFSFSGSNDFESCNNMINKVNEAGYSWLQFQSIEYSSSIYITAYPTAFYDGLSYVFKK